MGLSRAFGCFKDTSAQASKRQKKTGKRSRNENAQPNRVVATGGNDRHAGNEIRNSPGRPALPTTMAIRNRERSPSPGSAEPEPWSVGAVIRHTTLLQAKLANERKQTEVDVPNSEAKSMIETKPEAIAKEKEDKESSTAKTHSTLPMASTGDGGGEGSAVRATTMFGLQTTKKEPEVDLLAIEEEAENRRQMEENNALAAKGSYNGKYGGAKNWNSEYSQRASPVSLPDRNTRKSGWGRPGMGGTFGPPMDEVYYDYATGASSGSNNVHNSPYGYARKGHSYYGYISGPAN